MRHVTETFDVYQFSELSEQAKEQARGWFRSCMDCDDWDSTEWRDSMLAFADHFGFHITNWELGDGRGAHIDATFDRLDDCIRELSGVRLWKYLDANYGGKVTVRDGGTVGSPDDPYRPHKEWRDGHDWIRAGQAGECPFTGMYTDCALFDPLAEFVKRPDSRTFEELLAECLESHVVACRNAVEDSYSDEVVDSNIEANEYEFTKSGEHYT